MIHESQILIEILHRIKNKNPGKIFIYRYYVSANTYKYLIYSENGRALLSQDEETNLVLISDQVYD